MRYIDTKRIVSCCVDTFLEGRYTVSECIRQIDKTIQCETNCIPNHDIRIRQQYKLYSYGLDKLHKAILKMDRMN